MRRKQFDEFKASGVPIADADLDEYWETLRPATLDDMLGEWKGGEFDTGHRANGMLVKGNWFGKTFLSPSDAKPLICLNADGERFSNTEWMKGEASLWTEEFRGELVATMVYDGVPIHDHFKVVDSNTMMGIMNGKAALDNGRHLYFYLERV